MVAVLALCAILGTYVAAEGVPQTGSATRPLPAAAANETVQAIVAVNRMFEEVWNAVDRVSVDKLLDPEFTWITAAGVRLTREETTAQWPKLASLSHQSEVTQRLFGRVVLVQIRRGNGFGLRVWVSDPKNGPAKNGWRLLQVVELTQTPLPLGLRSPTPEEPTGVMPSETGVEADCVNPCLVLPYRAPAANARSAMTAFQQMEIAAAARDMNAWANHVTDDAILVDSLGEGPMSKAQRISAALDQKAGGAKSNEAPPVMWVRTFDVGGTVVMMSLQQPYNGQPFYATRVWISRGGRYQLALSYHVILRDVPLFTFSDQPDTP